MKKKTDIDKLIAKYRDLSYKLDKELPKKIIGILREILPEGTTRLDLSELLTESNLVEGIWKFYTPKDYPGNFRLETFTAADYGLTVEGHDTDDDSEYTFSEYDFETDEYIKIYERLVEVKAMLTDGTLRIDEDGTVHEALYRHLGYYNDTEDLRAMTGVSDEEIVQMMLRKEGAFHECDHGDELTLEEINDQWEDRKNFVEKVGDYLVVNEIKTIEDPGSAFAEDDPDSPVFVDIYQLITD